MSGLAFERSFASHEKSQYWDYEKNGEITPEIVTISSGNKCWFICRMLGNIKMKNKISRMVKK